MKIHNQVAALLLGASFLAPGLALAADKDQNSKFYDFSDQMIDGEVKKPPTMVMESRTRAKFEKLLRLKKSFKQAMIDSSKEPILK